MANKRRPSAYAPRRSSPGIRLWLPVGVLALIALLVILKLASPNGASPSVDNKPVAPSIVQALTTVPLASFAKATGTPTTSTSGPYGGSSTLWTVGGKPVFYYFGFEYCPYCAASRWAMVAALARFGTWSGLEYMNSSGTDVYPNTPTFTFVHATYTSSYVDFQSVENQTRVLGTVLQQPNSTQLSALQTYDAPPYLPAALGSAGAVPFVDIANRYIWSGSLYDPGYLAGLNWSTIAQDVNKGTSPVGTNILAQANILSAAICSVDGDQPSNVCTSAPVAALVPTLPKPAALPKTAKSG